MKTTAIGHKAEIAAANYLKKLGYKILDRNWRTRWCEIDVIASKDKIVFFAEVKYRNQDGQGKGLDYITARKLSQMQFAADNWVRENEWAGDYQLSAIEVYGDDFDVTNFIENIF
jgi:ribonuclease HII